MTTTRHEYILPLLKTTRLVYELVVIICSSKRLLLSRPPRHNSTNLFSMYVGGRVSPIHWPVMLKSRTVLNLLVKF